MRAMVISCAYLMLNKLTKSSLCGQISYLEVTAALQPLYPHDCMLCCTGNTSTYAT